MAEKWLKGARQRGCDLGDDANAGGRQSHSRGRRERMCIGQPRGGFAKTRNAAAIGALAASGQPHSFHTHQRSSSRDNRMYFGTRPKGCAADAWSRGMKVRTGGGPGGNMFYRPLQGIGGRTAKTESLGPQTIEGMTTEWTRTTRTIPAGEIGKRENRSPSCGALVFGRLADGRQEHSFGSPVWQ